LSTPTAVKVTKVAPWVHHSQVKLASLEWECIPDSDLLCKITLQKSQHPSLRVLCFLGNTRDYKQQDNISALVTLEAD
jgi:hypothetical protein